jgi:hypothetical protein
MYHTKYRRQKLMNKLPGSSPINFIKRGNNVFANFSDLKIRAV